jgi:nicotinamidase-related amidase
VNDELSLDPSRCALIVQDLQNDVIIEGGAFAESGSPEHAKEQNVVENVKDLAAACRAKGVPVIHVWYIVEPGAPGLKLNAPLFNGVKDGNALVRGTWGAAPAEGLEAQEGDHVVEKTRMSAWQGTKLENILAGLGRDTVIVTGAWTNMSIEHTSRTGADKGYFMVVPEDGCSTMNADWHNASINYALQNVSTVTTCAAVGEALSGVAGNEAREPARGLRPGHDHRHRRLDEHVHRTHVADRRRQGLLHGRAGGRLLHDERGLAQRLDQLRAPERLDRYELRGRDRGAVRGPGDRLRTMR